MMSADSISFVKRVAVLAVLAMTGSACGIRHVPSKILEKLPYEAKIELLESENDLALAVDRLDEARADISRTKEQIKRAKERLSAAKDEVSAAQDQSSQTVAELAVTEAETRVEWLRAHQRSNVREETLSAKNLECAYARYELSRLTSARKAKLEGSETLEPADFEGQVKACDEKFAELKEELKASNTEAQEIRAEWDKARAALAKKTFDARASPFVE